MSDDEKKTAWLAPPCVVVLVGPAGAGKSTWARAAFPHTRALSSDALREWLADDEGAQHVNGPVFDLLARMARARLEIGKRAIIDATNVKPSERLEWLELARELGAPAQAVWFDLDAEACARRQRERTRQVPRYVIDRQLEHLGDAREALLDEGWDVITRVSPEHEPGEDEVLRHHTPPLTRRLPAGGVRVRGRAYDIVGDVHGCAEELEALMRALGWRHGEEDGWSHPEDRTLVFVGDLVDRGPASLTVLELACDLLERERAVLVRGNHDDKLRRYLLGNDVTVGEGLATTVAELDALPEDRREALTQRALRHLDEAPYWALLGDDTGDRHGIEAEVVVSHAAWRPRVMFDRADRVRWYCMYGPTTGKTGEDGYPERLDWRQRYPEDAPRCVTGHTPFVGEVELVRNAMCLDTACVFGGRLTALRWPEDELVTTPAARAHSEHPSIGERPRFVTRRDKSPGK